MKNSNQQPWPTRPRPLGLIPKNSKPGRTIRAENAFPQTNMNRDAITTGPQMNTAASAANPDARASTFDETAYKAKHAKNSEDQARELSERTESPTITISREE